MKKLRRHEINTGVADAASVRREVLRTLSSVGHSGRAEIDVIGGSPRYSAHTTIVDREVRMKLDPDQSYILRERRLLRFLRQKSIAEPVVGLGNALARHEAGHTEMQIGRKAFGCPGTLENHYEIFMEEVTRALQEKGKNPNAMAGGRTAADYVANLIQDLITNYACQQAGPMDADMLFMYEQGITGGKYTKIYEAFSKLYAFINGKNEWNGLLGKFYGNEKKVNEAVAKIVKELGLKRGNCDSLLETGNWKRAAYVMAHNLADLLEFDGAGRVIIKQALPGGEHEVEPVPSGLPYKRYVEGRPLPRYMKAEDAIWGIYWELAGRLDIIAEGELKSMDLPCIPLTHEPFDPERHDPSDIDPFNPVFNYGDYELGVAKHRMSLQVPMKERKEGYPRVNIACLDRSQSMEEGIANPEDVGAIATIPWGDRSKYHYLFLGAVAIVRGLYEKDILDQVEMGGILFGSSSERVLGLDALKKALSSPQFQGSTDLDLNSIRQSVGDEPSVFMTISDGGVQNWASVKDEFMRLMRQNYYFHIQIGGETEMTRDLRRAGFTVIPVETGEELVRGMAQVTLQITEQHSRKGDY